jgi:surfactin synthase thioesterase subunit
MLSWASKTFWGNRQRIGARKATENMRLGASRCLVTLYAFPFAGGSEHSYAPLAASLPPSIDFRPLELPGRGARSRESLCDRLESIVDDLLAAIQSADGAPYALFGHSMGALLAYLTVRRVKLEGRVAPSHLIVSGAAAPSVSRKRYPLRSQLPSEQLIDCLEAMGGCPDAVLRTPLIWEFMEPILRADFAAVENFLYPGRALLSVPISLLFGVDDSIASEELQGWAEETSASFRMTPFPGGHFFINDASESVARSIQDILLPTTNQGASNVVLMSPP